MTEIDRVPDAPEGSSTPPDPKSVRALQMWLSSQWTGEYRYTATPGSDRYSWYHWTGAIWEPAPLPQVRKAARAEVDGYAAQTQQEKWYDASIGPIIDAVGDEIHDEDEPDRVEHQIPCLNGVLDLRTGELGGFDPAVFWTRQLPVPYLPDETSGDDEFIEILGGVLDPEQLAWFRQRVGQALTGVAPVDKFATPLLGMPHTGKSTVEQLLRDLFGKFSTKADNSILQARRHGDSHTEGRARMRGFRIALIDDYNGKINLAALKEIVGQAEMTARGAYGKAETIINSASLFFSFNDQYGVPLVRGAVDDAGLARIAPIRFHHAHVPGEEGTRAELQTRFPHHLLPAALRWAVRGAIETYEGQEYQQAKIRPDWIMDEIASKWNVVNDKHAFIAEELVPAEGMCITHQDMYGWYQSQLRKHGHRDQVESNTLPTILDSLPFFREYGIARARALDGKIKRARLRTLEHQGKLSRWTGAESGRLPVQSTVWEGVRFRRPDEEVD